ncbi:hypothetical protein SLEP1_g39387 [Rubroshorea leprosula]|uniref:Uncharacterized protein n=1 Tax=Rubroshorea leprosula TaxID=152421 RepID=A0AAV5L0J2_9ROSI|nr:hypothetical protein SLEP1_g39387 [Rubroshorea leprosula]
MTWQYFAIQAAKQGVSSTGLNLWFCQKKVSRTFLSWTSFSAFSLSHLSNIPSFPEKLAATIASLHQRSSPCCAPCTAAAPPILLHPLL